ncbi:SAM-dependent methyltransferase [Actinokineospora sp. PR83]|uniref:SAM-dependent methyltransferase n=1 Tax=Actinokineospora sp. PR83 TaxID=2884908 RepID=UPI001F410CC9|nr:SAM-dependent methyltransferase [Actinokineospora sp. PR83]MCG8916889.1 SAM-dependent methyltransferase [Actinokineospora sp. PR83]
MSDALSDPIPPQGIDLDRPSVARVYDYYLGGTANWAIDREFGQRVVERFPLVRNIAVANRLFLNRLVRHLTTRGIRQFLDIGAGVPTAGATHQVAAEITDDARVVYVDNEPVAVAHAEILLDEEGNTDRNAVIYGDLRDPDELWSEAMATGILDPDEPIALLMIAVLHVFQPDRETGEDIGAQCVARYRELLPRGSYLGISHITDDGIPPELGPKLAELKAMYDSSSSSNAIWRSRADITALMGDFELVDPGMVWTPEWHPEETGPNAKQIHFSRPNEAVIWAGAGRKP